MKKISPERKRIKNRAYAAKSGNQIKIRCRTKTNHAIKTGELVRQPCEHCGLDGKSEAHHEDYSKPLVVKWLCGKCHSVVHLGQRFPLRVRTHCPQGHAYAGDNIGMNGAWRRCRQCHRDQVAASKRRKSEQAVAVHNF